LLKAKCGQFFEFQLQGESVTVGTPQFCEIYLQELDQIFKISEKMEHFQSTLFLTSLPSGETTDLGLSEFN
jgi:hypothetical protein